MTPLRPTRWLIAAALAAACGSAVLAQDPKGIPKPQPRPEAPASGQVDLPAEVARYTALVRDPARFNAQNAAPQLKAGYEEVLSLSLETVDFRKVDADPQGLLQSLFGLMLAIDDRCAEFHAEGAFSDEIANAKRRALRAIRYLREAVILRTAEHAPDKLYAHGEPPLAREFPNHHWTVNPAFSSASPKDLPRTMFLLCMGSSNVSATIARSADEDNTFSHLAVGYRSPEAQVVDGQSYPPETLFLVESLIETGVIIKPFAEHYKGVDRDVIFIARDQSKQAEIDAAMGAFFQRANDALKAKKPLGYDFSMGANLGAVDRLQGAEGSGEVNKKDRQLPDPDTYFCAAIAYEVFAKVGLDMFPIRSRFNAGPNSRSLFLSWGINPDKPTTAPGDADVSPVLTRVAEAGLIKGMEVNHLRQATLRQMFRWMDEDNYQLRWPWWVTIGTAVAGGLNDTILDLGKVPSGMNKEILRTFTALDKAATLYYDALAGENARFRAKNRRSMTPHEMVAHLDSIRDKVDGTDRWLRKMPWAQGRYELSGSWKRRVLLEVKTGAQGDFSLTRRLYDRDGKLLETNEGSATQDEKTLSATFKRTRYTERSLRYRIEFDGTITESEREDRHGPRDNAPGYRRTGKGAKVAGQTHN